MHQQCPKHVVLFPEEAVQAIYNKMAGMVEQQVFDLLVGIQQNSSKLACLLYLLCRLTTRHPVPISINRPNADAISRLLRHFPQQMLMMAEASSDDAMLLYNLEQRQR